MNLRLFCPLEGWPVSGTMQEEAVPGDARRKTPAHCREVCSACLPVHGWAAWAGAEQSSSACALTEAGIKFSFSKESLCVYFKLQLFWKEKKNLFYSVFPGGWENVSWKQMYFLVVLRRKFEDLLYKGLTSLQKSSSSMQSCTAGYNVTIPGDPIKCIQCLTLVPGMWIPLLCLE